MRFDPERVFKSCEKKVSTWNLISRQTGFSQILQAIFGHRITLIFWRTFLW